MNNKKYTIHPSSETQNLDELEKPTGNIYKSISIISKRGNQIASEIKEELHKKLQEFASTTDNLEEVFENMEQIEISRYYEKLPNPALMAMEEFIKGKVYFRESDESEHHRIEASSSE